MLLARRDDVYARGIDIAVSENVRELRYILFDSVKRARKQMAQIMRKDLRGRDVRIRAQSLHLAPDIAPSHRLTSLRHARWHSNYQRNTKQDFIAWRSSCA